MCKFVRAVAVFAFLDGDFGARLATAKQNLIYYHIKWDFMLIVSAQFVFYVFISPPPPSYVAT